MSALIQITNRQIGDNTVQAVNARDLHAFLEVGKVFAAWITERIDAYGFNEGIDFVVFSETGKNSNGGRPAKEYALTMDMAKELSMVERNEKGKQARQYFIECERRVKEGLKPNPLKAAAEAARAFPPLVRVARLLGCDKNAAAIAANNAIFSASGINLMRQLGHTHLDAENQQGQWYTPTELGKQIGTSARGVNLLLAEAGMQLKVGEKWESTEEGKRFSRLFDTGKKHSTGVPVTQLKWSRDVLPIAANLGDIEVAA